MGSALCMVLLVAVFLWWQHRQPATPGLDSYGQKSVLFQREQPEGPLLKAYRAKLAAALASDQPIMKLEGLDENAAKAQDAAVGQADMQAAAHDKDSGQALRSEVFQVYKLPSSEANGKTEACASGLQCYVVEIYFYADNNAGKVIAGIDGLGNPKVLDSGIVAHSQPELPQALTDITKELINGSQELKDVLGKTINTDQLVMVNGKTALGKTRCERSEHLCVAPTLALNDEAEWIIIDLTDARIVGVTWTEWNDEVPPAPPSEQTTIDNAIMQKYCGVANNYDKNGWKFSYALTGSDGVELKGVSYKGAEMLASVKVPDWHVNYSGKDAFGYSDAVGCPVFSTAAVVPATEPKFEDIKQEGKTVGFELVQDFRSKLWPQPCNYYYQQRYQFFNDGSFRPVQVSLGRGCGDDGTYRPVTRIQPAAAFNKLEAWNDSRWQTVGKEMYQHETYEAPLPSNDQGVSYRLQSHDKAIDITLGRGQFGDGGRGDQPWLYFTQFHADRDEGSSDMATLGACCNTDAKQGPDVFVNGESLINKPLLLWYVAEQKNDGTSGEEYCWARAEIIDGVYKTTTYPCPSGPKLQLTGKP